MLNAPKLAPISLPQMPQTFSTTPLAHLKPMALNTPHGQVAEWSKAHAWKVCRRGTVSRVRIPLSPPNHLEIIELNGLTLLKPTFAPTIPRALG